MLLIARRLRRQCWLELSSCPRYAQLSADGGQEKRQTLPGQERGNGLDKKALAFVGRPVGFLVLPFFFSFFRHRFFNRHPIPFVLFFHLLWRSSSSIRSGLFSIPLERLAEGGRGRRQPATAAALATIRTQTRRVSHCRRARQQRTETGNDLLMLPLPMLLTLRRLQRNRELLVLKLRNLVSSCCCHAECSARDTALGQRPVSGFFTAIAIVASSPYNWQRSN